MSFYAFATARRLFSFLTLRSVAAAYNKVRRPSAARNRRILRAAVNSSARLESGGPLAPRRTRSTRRPGHAAAVPRPCTHALAAAGPGPACPYPHPPAHFRALPRTPAHSRRHADTPTRRHADTPTRGHADTPACELPPERDTRHRADVSGHARGPPRSVGGAPSIAPTPRADGCSPRRRARGAHQGGTRTGPARDHANHAPVAPPQHSILRCRGPWADLLLCHRLFDDALPLSNARVLLRRPSIGCGQ